MPQDCATGCAVLGVFCRTGFKSVVHPDQPRKNTLRDHIETNQINIEKYQYASISTQSKLELAGARCEK